MFKYVHTRLRNLQLLQAFSDFRPLVSCGGQAILPSYTEGALSAEAGQRWMELGEW